MASTLATDTCRMNQRDRGRPGRLGEWWENLTRWGLPPSPTWAKAFSLAIVGLVLGVWQLVAGLVGHDSGEVVAGAIFLGIAGVAGTVSLHLRRRDR
jgi:hypothetical protein